VKPQKLLDPKDGVWPLHQLQPVLYKTGGPDSPRRSYFGIRFEGDERAGIIGALAQLIQAAGEHLRACVECGLPFVAVKRQEYCWSSCAWRTRNKRRLAKKTRAVRRPRK